MSSIAFRSRWLDWQGACKSGVLENRGLKSLKSPSPSSSPTPFGTFETPSGAHPQKHTLLDPADRLALLDALHAELRAGYVVGALPWAMQQPDLQRRFDLTETAIDRAFGANPTEAEWRRVLADHAAVWRELVARYRAHRDQQQGCRHTSDPEVRAWRADNPGLECARCWRDR